MIVSNRNYRIKFRNIVLVADDTEGVGSVRGSKTGDSE